MVADSVNYLSAEFMFKDAAWSKLTKYAHFQLGENCYDFQLKNDQIQPEDGLNLQAGKWTIHLHGDRYEDGELAQRITTNSCTFVVDESGCLEGDAFPSIDTDLATELLARLDELEQNGGGSAGSVVADGK